MKSLKAESSTFQDGVLLYDENIPKEIYLLKRRKILFDKVLSNFLMTFENNQLSKKLIFASNSYENNNVTVTNF